ncbi:MAG TPA: HEAT repeat domain-containing protein [Anaerolineales bacterium]|nr:HEAT repeat domain-containing protein [Anaerolineales bacterium]
MTDERIPFQEVVDALLDTDRDFPRRFFSYFSDIDPTSLTHLMDAWPRVKPTRKRSLLDSLEATAQEDTLVSFDEFGRALLTDPDATVRVRAIRLLAECDDPKLVPTYIRILQEDEDADVRAEAANALGKFVMLGELEEIPEKTHRAAEEALLKNLNSEDDAMVRRRALESLGFSARVEVPTLLDSAYHRKDSDWQSSALLAMGRSGDDRWQEHVIQMLTHENPRVQLAAVKAAGELGLASARPILLRLLEDAEDDDVIAAAIWSLSQIGGEDARTYLETLVAETDDEDLSAFLEDALENLAFTEDLDRFDLMSFDTGDEVEEE